MAMWHASRMSRMDSPVWVAGGRAAGGKGPGGWWRVRVAAGLRAPGVLRPPGQDQAERGATGQVDQCPGHAVDEGEADAQERRELQHTGSVLDRGEHAGRAGQGD